MATADEVIVEFEARVGKYEADLKRSAATFERVTKAQQQQMLALERQISASTGIIGGAFKGLAALFSAQQVTKLSDDYTRLQNSLKVAGLEGESLLDVQGQLLDLGGKYGVSVNELSNLYGNASQAASDLGASQGQLVQLTEATAQALKITGTNATQAQGAILGLTQALASGTVRAEEFNQINEGGLRPLLQIAANAEKYGGSIAKLRLAVTDGKVSSQEFYRAILNGSEQLDVKASKATLTLEGAYTALNNRLIEFVGSAASSSGAAGALASGLQSLADNLDTVSKALAVIVAIVGVRWTVATASAATSSIALAAANTRAALTAEALAGATYQANAALLGEAAAARIATASVTNLSVAQGLAARTGGNLLAAVGGPLGAAVLALGAGIAVLASREAELQSESDQLSSSIAAQTAEFENLRQKKAQAAAATNTLSSAQRGALVDTANLTGEAGKLANAWARVAAEAKNAALAQARARWVSAQGSVSDAQARLDRLKGESPGSILNGNNLSPLDRIRAIGNSIIDPSGKKLNAKTTQAQNELNAAQANLADAFSQFTKVTLTSLDEFKADAVPTAVDPKKKGSGKSKADGPDAERAEQDMARLRMEELQARLDLATTAEARADLQKQILEEERKQRLAEIDANKDLTKDQKRLAREAIDRLYGPSSKPGELVVSPSLYGSKAQRDADQQRAREAQDLADEQNRAQQEILRNQYDLADSSAERKRLALASIDLEDRYQRAQLQAIIDLEGANSAAGKRAQIALDAQTEITNGRKASALRSNQSPLEAYRDKLDRDAGETNDLVEGYVVDELQSVRDSIRSSIEKQIGIKDPLISGLLNMLIEDVLIKPIANALSQAQGSGGGLLGGIISGIGSLFGGGRAIGGPVQAGKVYKVGESGEELFRPQQNGVIVPNHRLNGNSGSIQKVTIQVQANDYFDARVAGISHQVAVPIAQQVSAQTSAAMGQNILKAVPGRVATFQRDGT